MRTTKNRLLVVLLSVAMLITTLPTAVFAEIAEDAQTTQTEQTEQTEVTESATKSNGEEDSTDKTEAIGLAADSAPEQAPITGGPGYVAKIVETGVEYETVQDAINAAAESQTVQMIADTEESIVINAIRCNNNITLDLNGHVLKGSSESNCVFLIENREFTLDDTMPEATHSGDYEDYPQGGIVTGSTIGVKLNASSAVLNMRGGTIYNNGGNGANSGGVYIFTGTFNMSGGAISNNNSMNNGAGVEVGEDCTFNMSGGKITGNSLKSTIKIEGSGVYNCGTFNMSGGEISENTAANKAIVAGVCNKGTMTVGGTAKITGNTKNSVASNLYLPSSNTIAIGTKTSEDEDNGVPALAEGASIGITMAAKTGQFTSNGTQSDKKYFSSDITDYSVKFVEATAEPAVASHLELAEKTVCKIGTTEYKTIAAALAATQTNEGKDNPTVITMIDDDEENVTIDSTRFITLDLNGYVIKAQDGDRVICNYGTLTVKDSDASKNADAQAVHAFTVDSDGLWALNSDFSGTADYTFDATNGLKKDGTASSDIPASGATIAVSGGCITGGVTTTTSTESNVGGGIYNIGTLTISGGNIVGNQSVAAPKGEGQDYGYSAHGGGVCTTGSATMTGGAIIGNTVSGNTEDENDNFGGGIYVNSGAEFELSKGYVSYNKASGDGDDCLGWGGGVSGHGTIKMSGGTVSGNAGDCSGGVLTSYGTLTISNGTISGNTATYSGGGIYNGNGKLTISGATIKENTASGAGGGIYTTTGADKVATIDTDVIITANKAQSGGGIYNAAERKQDSSGAYYLVANTGRLTIEGTVSNNEATYSGGGVYNNSGTLTVSGATIKENTAEYFGGGIYTWTTEGNSVTIDNDASITANEAYCGGGIYNKAEYEDENETTPVSNTGRLTINGGVVSNNECYYYYGEGGGVYNKNGTLTLGGNVKITENNEVYSEYSWSLDNNLYLTANTTVNISTETPLVIGASIGVTTQTAPTKGNPVAVTGENSDNYSSFFTSDSTDYKVYNTKSGELQIVKLSVHEHTWTYGTGKTTTDGDTLKAWCTETFGISYCDYQEAKAQTVTIQAPTALEYNGEAKAATLSGETLGELTLKADDIKYQKKKSDDNWENLGSAPVDAGTYKASITIGSGTNAKTASVVYTITKKELTVSGTTVQKTKVYDGTTDATVTVNGTLEGVIDKDDVSIATASASYDNKNVGTSKSVTVSYTLNGAKAGNYTVKDTTDLKAAITAKQLTVSGTNVASSKEYDGNTTANVTAEGTLDGIIDSDSVKLDTVTATYADAEVGTSKPITVKYTIKGDDSGNYLAPADDATFTADITEPQIVLSGISATAITYGQALSESTISGTAKYNGSAIEGTWTWQTETTKPAVSDSETTEYTVVFTPEDTKFNEKEGTVKLKVNKRTVTLTSATDSKTYDGSPLTNDTVTVGGDGWADGEGATYDVTGSQTVAGNSQNTFTYALKDGTTAGNYNIEKAEGKLTVNAIATEIVITADSNTKKYDGTALTDNGFTFTENVLLDGDVLSATVEGTIKDAGTVANKVTSYNVTNAAGEDVTSCYTFGTSVDGKLTVNKRAVTLTSATDTKTYDGTPLTNSNVAVSGDGFVTGEGANYTVTGSQTVAGNSKNTFTYDLKDGTKAGNYNIEKVEGKLTVNAIATEIVITANSNTKKYDGTALTDDGYTYTGKLAEGDKLKATVVGTITDAGTADNIVTDYKVMRGDVDVTSCYTFGTSVDGKLTVNKRAITLTSATDTQTYDGTPLTNSNVAVSGDGFVTGEGASYTVTGSQTIVGTSKNTFTYTLWDGTGEGQNKTKADNYNITTVEGDLTVKATAPITITANSATKTYDGTELKDSGFTYTGTLAGGDVLTATVVGTITDAGTADNVVTDYKVMRGDVDVTSCYTFADSVDGTLEVTPAQITVTGSTAKSRPYDSTAVAKIILGTVTGIVEGDDVTLSATGAFNNKNAGEDKTVTITFSATGEDVGNYILPGSETCTATIHPLTLTISGTEVADKIYDGTTDATISKLGEIVLEENFIAQDDVAIDTATAIFDSADASDSVGAMISFTLKGADAANYTTLDERDYAAISKRSVTLTSATASKTYDGSPLTNDTVTVGGDGWADGEGATYSGFASLTKVGSIENSFTYTLYDGTEEGKEATNAENYNITTEFGTLTVNQGAKTSDTNDMMPYALMLMFSIFGLAGYGLKRRDD